MCGERHMHETHSATALNPTLILKAGAPHQSARRGTRLDLFGSVERRWENTEHNTSSNHGTTGPLSKRRGWLRARWPDLWGVAKGTPPPALPVCLKEPRLAV